ncbi:helix-turn-helix domain-containing protein [Barrientosiimonas endolithica]|uniref:helix-turn-helix domain-containing protein n=1 Tax=Barrientosiimonas endolithica TaxID=1535208 RepID=UPI00259B170E|nr:helix-turn-helix domain-containing protein [Barrientosiimonas endolithica]
MSDDFGATLRGLRLACGLTQEQLAERCGLSVEGISVLERGRRKRPRASTIDALVRGLGLDEDDARRMRQVCSRRRVGETWTRPDQVRPGWALRPAQLPAPPPLHVGRDDLVRAVTDRLREPAGLAPQVVGITGMAGIGKTSLALRVGHAVAPDFPDGQIYLDLRGHHPAGALDTRAALAYLLVSLGVHSDDVPRDADQAAAAYRTLTNGTRLLVVLDDAADHEGAADVAQLLPGTAGNAVVVVSRSGLSAPTSAFHLGRLDDASATELLRHVLGRERTDPDADALRRLVEGCAGLPLALRIVGARLQARPRGASPTSPSGWASTGRWSSCTAAAWASSRPSATACSSCAAARAAPTGSRPRRCTPSGCCRRTPSRSRRSARRTGGAGRAARPRSTGWSRPTWPRSPRAGSTPSTTWCTPSPAAGPSPRPHPPGGTRCACACCGTTSRSPGAAVSCPARRRAGSTTARSPARSTRTWGPARAWSW